MPQRANNDRKYPEGSGPRPDLSASKRLEANERQAYFDSLTVEQRLEVINNPRPATNQERCGGEAKKVRAKLAMKKLAPVPRVERQEVAETVEVESADKKRVKAKERRRKEQGEEE